MSHCATEKAYLEEKKAKKWNSQYDPSFGKIDLRIGGMYTKIESVTSEIKDKFSDVNK